MNWGFTEEMRGGENYVGWGVGEYSRGSKIGTWSNHFPAHYGGWDSFCGMRREKRSGKAHGYHEPTTHWALLSRLFFVFFFIPC